MLQQKFPATKFEEMAGIDKKDIKPFFFESLIQLRLFGHEARFSMLFPNLQTGWYGGIKAETDKTPAPPGQIAHWELNKDWRGSTRGKVTMVNGVTLFELAESAARQQTALEFERFKKELKANAKLKDTDLKKAVD